MTIKIANIYLYENSYSVCRIRDFAMLFGLDI
jgi:hypothetical protein